MFPLKIYFNNKKTLINSTARPFLSFKGYQ